MEEGGREGGGGASAGWRRWHAGSVGLEGGRARGTVKVDDRHLEAVHSDGVRCADRHRVEQAESAAARHRVKAVDARVVARRAHKAERHGRRLRWFCSQRTHGAVDGGDDGTSGARCRAPRARRDSRHAEWLILREDALDQHRRQWARGRVGARLVAIAHRVERCDEPVRVAAAERSLVGGRKVGSELDAIHAARTSKAHGVKTVQGLRRVLARGGSSPSDGLVDGADSVRALLMRPFWRIARVMIGAVLRGQSVDISRAQGWPSGGGRVGAHVVLVDKCERRAAAQWIGGPLRALQCRLLLPRLLAVRDRRVSCAPARHCNVL